MASRCRKCGQQVPRNLPFTAVRITEGEMKSYHDFIGGCIKLECMAKKDELCYTLGKLCTVICGQKTQEWRRFNLQDFINSLKVSFFTCTDEIMQQEIRPLVAVDIIEQLHRQFAILSGGRGKDGAPIITFPEFAGFSEIPDEDFLNVVTYLTSIPRQG
ncbi:hypothetical protein ASZ78_016543 [Callipepla squamata]|uniref:Uncharacterized protein n=1 Tax=Callipepla squamata TaxID=9009 RepID=A0A226MZP5_CALSU|nr:hypothetical protein ASZ78_016543 [Callipepla squamata]